jgi:hypothetical protein
MLATEVARKHIPDTPIVALHAARIFAARLRCDGVSRGSCCLFGLLLPYPGTSGMKKIFAKSVNRPSSIR